MKHTIQTLKKNLTLAEVEALEKEVREKLKEPQTIFYKELIWEILGE